MVLIVLAILLAGLICLIGYYTILADSLLGGYDFATSHLAIQKVVEILKSRRGNFYDLGSARGDFLFQLIKQAPHLNYYGLDNSLFRTSVAKLKAWVFATNATFLCKDIFNVDLSDANTVYVYLPQDLMPDLETKLLKELKSGSFAITNRVSFPSWQPAQIYKLSTSEKLFVYVKN